MEVTHVCIIKVAHVGCAHDMISRQKDDIKFGEAPLKISTRANTSYLQCAHVVEAQETRAFAIVLEPRAINDGLQETGEPL